MISIYPFILTKRNLKFSSNDNILVGEVILVKDGVAFEFNYSSNGEFMLWVCQGLDLDKVAFSMNIDGIYGVALGRNTNGEGFFKSLPIIYNDRKNDHFLSFPIIYNNRRINYYDIKFNHVLFNHESIFLSSFPLLERAKIYNIKKNNIYNLARINNFADKNYNKIKMKICYDNSPNLLIKRFFSDSSQSTGNSLSFTERMRDDLLGQIVTNTNTENIKSYMRTIVNSFFERHKIHINKDKFLFHLLSENSSLTKKESVFLELSILYYDLISIIEIKYGMTSTQHLFNIFSHLNNFKYSNITNDIRGDIIKKYSKEIRPSIGRNIKYLIINPFVNTNMMARICPSNADFSFEKYINEIIWNSIHIFRNEEDLIQAGLVTIILSNIFQDHPEFPLRQSVEDSALKSQMSSYLEELRSLLSIYALLEVIRGNDIIDLRFLITGLSSISGKHIRLPSEDFDNIQNQKPLSTKGYTIVLDICHRLFFLLRKHFRSLFSNKSLNFPFFFVPPYVPSYGTSIASIENSSIPVSETTFISQENNTISANNDVISEETVVSKKTNVVSDSDNVVSTENTTVSKETTVVSDNNK